jgi:hypothetical protein
MIIGCLLFVQPAAADVTQYYFKFQAQSKDQIDKLTTIISIDNVDGLTVYAYANAEEFEAFKNYGIKYEMLPSPGTLIVPEISSDWHDLITDWDTYPTYQGYLDMMAQFASTYPDLCRIVNIGSSVQGRQLLFAKISDNVDTLEDEPEVMFSSSMHGDETTGYVLMLRLIDYLLSNYNVDPRVTSLVNNLEIWINPLANPDGTYHGGDNSVYGAIRYNANGADLNRNFADPAAGPHPDGRAWQPETIAMMDFFGQHNFVISANFHGGAEVVNYLWDTWARRHADDSWLIDCSRAYAETCQAYSPSGYMTDLNDGITNGYDWYRVTGGRQDYISYFRGGRETTIEISQTKLLPAGQLPAHWDYNYRSFLQFFENALFGVRGLVTDSATGLPLAAQINVLSHDIDSADVHTDPDVGDYHRMLDAGSYSLQFVSPGYVSRTFDGITVADRATTLLNVQLQTVPGGPLLSIRSHDAGVVDPGDAVSMNITLVNDGGGSAENVNGILSTADPYVAIDVDSAAFPSISPLGGTGTSLTPYHFIVDSTCPMYHLVGFRLDLTASGGYVDSEYFEIIIGRQIEDFETGDFTRYAWQMGGNNSWVITNVAPYEGIYSARSGIITHNQRSELSVQLSLAAAGEIIFHYKVSSEATYDFLRFYIDSNLRSEWSGEVAWSEVSFPVTAGTHTFKWGYYKDGSVSHGSDCGWVDFIVFPAIGLPIQITTLSVPDWTAGFEYSKQLIATGGIGQRTWSDFDGGLSGTGLTLSSDGLIGGIPSNAGPISFTARVEDAIGGFAQRLFNFTINPSVEILSDSLPNGAVGIPYSVQLEASGGTGSLRWTDRDNDLAGTGLSLSQAGLVSGTPLAIGVIAFTAVVADSVGASAERYFEIAVTGGSSYIPGDANNSGQANGIDVTYMVSYFKGGTAPLFWMDCPPHGVIYSACDVNASCSVNGLDVTYFVSFLKGGSPLLFCPDCPPERMAGGTRGADSSGR